MHRVDRGPEPEGLEAVRSRYTPRWVDHYRNGNGSKPSDSRWRDFHDDLRQVFFGLCAYCEEFDKGEVDHFRPKKRSPELVYEWPNWVFACRHCNSAKGSKWPSGGYVDPCAKTKRTHPESYFTFDMLTGEILPKDGLSSGRRKKARQMIEDLKLNIFDYHMKKRRAQLEFISQVISNDSGDDATIAAFLKKITRRTEQFSSITRVMLAEKGYSVDVD